jgi:hypothetical protein
MAALPEGCKACRRCKCDDYCSIKCKDAAQKFSGSTARNSASFRIFQAGAVAIFLSR